MGAWGIRERQSDYGLDLLGTIVGTQLKAVDFAIFNTAEAIELLRQDIMEDIKRTNRAVPRRGWTATSTPTSRETLPMRHS